MDSKKKANVRVVETSKLTCRTKIQEMVENGVTNPQSHPKKMEVQEAIVLNSSP